MTDSQLTQCPHCKASFKVTDEQLSVANGRVRCGACLNIFDAIAYRINSPLADNEHQDIARELDIGDDDFSFMENTVDLENELLDDDLRDIKKPHAEAFQSDEPAMDAFEPESLEAALEDDTLFADDPEEDKQEKGYTGANKFGDELSTSFLELEKSSATPFSAESLNDQVVPAAEPDNIDESWAASILDDLEEPGSNKIETGLGEPITSPNPQSHSNQIAPSRESGAQSATFKQSNGPSETENSSSTDFETHSTDLLAFDKKDLNSLSFQYEQDQAPKYRWLAWSLFALVNISLLLLLIAQASWYHYEKLVKYPKVAALYEFACQQLGCTLPELADISKIENRNLVVKSHPTVFKALIIETIITNQAPFDQAFPDISLSFSDINNNVIAQRLFKPAEYLSSEVLNWPAMPAKQPIQITLEIIDPGPEAVNYKVEFYPNSSPSELQKNDQMSTNKSKI